MKFNPYNKNYKIAEKQMHVFGGMACNAEILRLKLIPLSNPSANDIINQIFFLTKMLLQ